MHFSSLIVSTLAACVLAGPAPQPATLEEMNALAQSIYNGGSVPDGVQILEEGNTSPSSPLVKRQYSTFCGGKCDGKCCCTFCSGWRCSITCGVLVGCKNDDIC